MPRGRSVFSAILPHLISAGAAVLITLLIVLLLPVRPSAAPPLVATSTPPAALATTVGQPAAASPAPSEASATPVRPSSADAGVLSQEIIDLRDENRQLWSALYLMRAAMQLKDLELALQNNDLAEVERLLLTVRVSFDAAYAFSAEQEKGPIEAFRLDLGRISDDLRLRPEGLDRRLNELRGLVLSLVDEGG
jgi:predicted lipid-binding transport protein (Tim44 family)